MSKVVLVAMVVGAVGACGGGTAKPAEVPTNSAAPDCAGAAGVIVRSVEAKSAKGDRPAVTSAVTKRCTDDHWTEEAVHCMSGTHDKQGVHDCGYNHLTQAQQDKLDKATEPVLASATDEVMQVMIEFKDQLCACKDANCVQGVSDAMTRWSQEMSRKHKDPPRMTDEQARQAAAIGEEMGKCMQAAMSAGTPPTP